MWQMKIMDFYKRIFANGSGIQTSQMFVVTHSPFIIHNKNRRNTLHHPQGSPQNHYPNQECSLSCALRLLDAFDNKVSYLENTPMIGCARLKYIPSKYRVITFWPHLWMVFQVKKDELCVKIKYIIDDRQNYGSFLK